MSRNAFNGSLSVSPTFSVNPIVTRSCVRGSTNSWPRTSSNAASSRQAIMPSTPGLGGNGGLSFWNTFT